MQKSLLYLLSHPRYVIGALISKGYFLFPSEKLYLKTMYRFKMHKKLDLVHPKTFNEKLNWIKLYDRKPIYPQMVDKYTAKLFVANKLRDYVEDDIVIPTVGVWSKGEEIDWNILPEAFVLKASNGGGGNGIVICRQKSKLNKEEAIKKLNYNLKSDFYHSNLEWPYKNAKPQIIAEEFLDDGTGDLKDYKLFCFNGIMKFCKVDFGRFVEHHANYYDREWNLLPFGEVVCPPQPEHLEEKPENFNKMIKIAECLSQETLFLRVDLYNVSGKIYFGECTFFPGAGFNPFIPDEYDEVIGGYLKLPNT